MPDALIFRCKHCDAPIGAQTDAALIVGAAKFFFTVTMECLLCKRTLRWKPGPSFSRAPRDVASKDVARDAPPGVES